VEIKYEVAVSLKGNSEDAVVIAYFADKSRADYMADSLKKGYNFTVAREYTGGAY
jgi:hypothetical protein